MTTSKNNLMLLKIIGSEILASIESRLKSISVDNFKLDTPKLISSDIQQVEANEIKVDQYNSDGYLCITNMNEDQTSAIRLIQDHNLAEDKTYLCIDLRFSVELNDK